MITEKESPSSISFLTRVVVHMQSTSVWVRVWLDMVWKPFSEASQTLNHLHSFGRDGKADKRTQDGLVREKRRSETLRS